MKFITKKDKTKKTIKFNSGMIRKSQDDKPRYDLCYLPLMTRWAELMSRGAKKYGERNWEFANSVEELLRFKAAAFRHFMQWFENVKDGEDHAAAILFNVGAVEMVKEKLRKK